MGFFDNLLKDIASGEIDKKLEKLADNVEKISAKLDDSVKTLAEKPENVSKKADQIGTSVAKSIRVVSE